MAKFEEISDGLAKVILSKPVTEGDEKVTELVFRKDITWGDLRALGDENNTIDSSIKLFAGLCQPKKHITTIQKIGVKDATDIQLYISQLTSQSEDGVENNDEKKTSKTS